MKAARIISLILHPFSLAPVVLFLVAYWGTKSFGTALQWTLLTFLLAELLPLLYLLSRIKKGRITDFDISLRNQRPRIFAVALFSLILCLAVLIFLKAPLILIAAIIGTEAGLAIGAIITLYWKVSLHTGGVACAVLVSLWLYGPIMIPTILLLPLIGWARTKVEAHTPAQIIVGALIGFLIPIIVFTAFGILPSLP